MIFSKVLEQRWDLFAHFDRFLAWFLYYLLFITRRLTFRLRAGW